MVHEPFTLVEHDLLKISEWEKEDKNLIAGFTTRLGGVGEKPYYALNVGLHVADDDRIVIKNRQIVATELGIPLEQWVVGEQIHGANITKVTSDDCGKGGRTLESAIKGIDGLYTKEQDILLVSLYADCVPLYFYSSKHHMIGLAHAGWKGTVSQIGPKMIESWTTNEGINASDILVTIGPAICQKEYEVDTNVIKAVDDVLPSIEERPYQPSRPGHYLLDLKKLNKQLLINAGVPKENIQISQYCTASNTELFFSHRKESGKTGRMMSFIGLKGY
ncbi:peptidoglycan editing factor PgeF [Alkalihalobacillus sp. BA299]|uniref:peptidoglycan editing factor PgeF n=1 Tax=Alkalihalobacillus sp. BA299 TaxID=2815938 RepID=UPI001FFE1025|nr:peptidoglycan editing factor PgeF [Alkalihalobacillus sp. BA299]